jgi:hypothetical protein
LKRVNIHHRRSRPAPSTWWIIKSLTPKGVGLFVFMSYNNLVKVRFHSLLCGSSGPINVCVLHLLILPQTPGVVSVREFLAVMKIRELIEELQKLNPEIELFVVNTDEQIRPLLSFGIWKRFDNDKQIVVLAG